MGLCYRSTWSARALNLELQTSRSATSWSSNHELRETTASPTSLFGIYSTGRCEEAYHDRSTCILIVTEHLFDDHHYFVRRLVYSFRPLFEN